MELIELIFKSKNIDPRLTVNIETGVFETSNKEITASFRRTSQRYEIDPTATLTGLKVTIMVDKLWYGTECIAEEYTLISHKTVRNLTAENIMAVINQHI